MSYTVIDVQSLAKRYRIGSIRGKSKTIGDSLARALDFRKIRAFGQAKPATDYFWALRDVTFKVKHGDVVGIIGHNGAGKSTLLKILARITEPTHGSADIHGRVGSLLEVGTGFHFDLTGRENIYLSGAILGMKKNDIDRRFDEMVAFAEVEKFIDTPIKHYSSGMHLRLAFAVAAHLEPEILLIDEVLAVGDLAFQKKCLNKMEDVASEGRTILFVSHNMGAVKELCQTALVLRNGKEDYFGPVVTAIRHYSGSLADADSGSPHEYETGGLTQTRVNSTIGGDCRIKNDEPINIVSHLSSPKTLLRVVIHCLIEDAECRQIAHNYVRAGDIGKYELAAGKYRIEATVPPLWLKPGVYTLYLKLLAETDDANQVRYTSERIVLDISDSTGLFAGKTYASILPPVSWTIADAVKKKVIKAQGASRL